MAFLIRTVIFLAIGVGLVGAPLPAWALAAPTACTSIGTSFCARNWARAALALSASMRPVLLRPAASRASKR